MIEYKRLEERSGLNEDMFPPLSLTERKSNHTLRYSTANQLSFILSRTNDSLVLLNVVYK